MNVKKLVLVFLVTCSIAACAPAQADGDLSSKDTVVAFIGDLSDTASANGQVLPQCEAALSFGTPSRVTHVAVDAGDTVQAGDVLVQVENDALRRAVRKAELDLATQEINLADLHEDASAKDIAAARALFAAPLVVEQIGQVLD